MKYLNFIKYKHPFWVLIFLSNYINTKAQTNLVPNPSFEQYTNCPNRNLYIGTGNPKNVHLIKPDIWFKPDFGGGGYFNACANVSDTAFGVPYNYIYYSNYQIPRSGNAYVSMVYGSNSSTNDRLYYEVKLLDSLKAGHCYYAEYYVSLWNDANVGCNNQAMLFTKKAVYADTLHSNYFILANPQIKNYGNLIIIDTLNWVKVSGVFTAQGGEQYLTLGNFNNGATTNHKIFQTNFAYTAAYYADDVSVYEIDTFKVQANAGADKTIQNGDSAFIGSYTNGIDIITWRDATGTIINTQAPGFYVTPSSNTFYTVEQTVCGYTSKDTVYINVLLPLKFISFNVSQSISSPLGGIKGGFTTANEINVSHYNIERSINAKDFEKLGTVKANNNNYNEYNFNDLLTTNYSLPTTLYYRITGIDKDGKKTYSKVQSLTINHLPLTINIYPNPCKDFINITGNNIQQITISSIEGKKLLSTVSKKINISNLANGIYLITIKIYNNYVTEKFIKY